MNNFTIKDRVAVVDVSTGKFPNAHMLIDESDFNSIRETHSRIYAWMGYACARPVGSRKPDYIHRLLFPEAKVVDHVNGNGRDNRRENLRPCTQKQNSRNTRIAVNNKSGVTGVHFCSRRKKWVAGIRVEYRRIHLGRFDSFDDAVSARRSAEQKYFGDYAPGKGAQNVAV